MSNFDVSDLMQQARDFLAEHGLVLRGELDTSGQWAYCGTTKKPDGINGHYKFHLDFPSNITAFNYNDGGTKHQLNLLTEDEAKRMTAAEREAIREKIRQEKEASKRRLEASRQAAAKRARGLFESLPLAGADNGYLSRKSVPPKGDLRQGRDGRLLLPVLNSEGQIVSCQFIAPDGSKFFLKGGETRGCYFPIPARDGDKTGPLLIAEGVATALSVAEATGFTTLAAFSAGNLEPVARMARAKYPEREIVLCADNDVATAGNPGVSMAKAAVQAVGGILAVCPCHEGNPTDFNDLQDSRGLPVVRDVIMKALEASRKLRCLNVADFISKAYPPREMLLSPVIARQSLSMVFAMRGLGKTYFALTVGLACASGGKAFGRWQASHPIRVLYIDGEMPAPTLQERIMKLMRGASYDIVDPDMFRILTPDEQTDPMPNLSTKEGQALVEPHLAGVSLVILDNLATLARTGKSNDEDSWVPVQEWLLSLRRRGISVLLVHHAGKSGTQRGTIAKEDVLDNVLELRRPADYKSEEGCRFEVHFSKARGLCGKDTEPFEATLRTTDDGGYEWLTRDVANVQLEQVKELLAAGLTVREIADETGMSKSTVDRLKKKLKGEGKAA